MIGHLSPGQARRYLAGALEGKMLNKEAVNSGLFIFALTPKRTKDRYAANSPHRTPLHRQ